MKKIIYMIAPLMAVPFMMTSCKKTTLYNVGIKKGTSSILKFTSDSGKEITREGKKLAVDGKDFVFHVEVVDYSEEAGEEPYLIKEGIIIEINNVSYLDFSFVPESYIKSTDHVTKAKVTIPGERVKGDIKVGGTQTYEDYYIYYVPFQYGVTCSVAATHIYSESGDFGYVKSGDTLTVTCEVKGDYSKPLKENVVYSINGGEFQNPDATFETSGTFQIADSSSENEYVIIGARAHGYSFLEDLSWDDIKLIVDEGYAAALFEIGETKTITVNDMPHVIQIIGINHDTLASDPTKQAKASITFQFKTLYSDTNGAVLTHWSDTYYSDTANYNYTNSTVHKLLEGDVFNNLPDKLKADGMIKRVNKYVGLYSTSTTSWGDAKEFQPKMFILAQQETNETKADYAVTGEANPSGTYAYYKGKSGSTLYDLRTLKDANGDRQLYWLRSPRTGSGGVAAYAIDKDGEVDSRGQYCRTHEYAIAPCFCI